MLLKTCFKSVERTTLTYKGDAAPNVLAEVERVINIAGI